MTKYELITEISEKAMTTRYVASEVYEFFIESIIESCLKEGRMIVSGLGTFKLKARPARTTHNPKTGEKIEVPTRYTIAFRPAAELRRRLACIGG